MTQGVDTCKLDYQGTSSNTSRKGASKSTHPPFHTTPSQTPHSPPPSHVPARYFTAKQSNPIFLDVFGRGLGKILDGTIGRQVPGFLYSVALGLGRSFLLHRFVQEGMKDLPQHCDNSCLLWSLCTETFCCMFRAPARAPAVHHTLHCHSRVGPLARLFLDNACGPFTSKYNDSLTAYLNEPLFANSTLGSLVRPIAHTLDDRYAAVSG